MRSSAVFLALSLLLCAFVPRGNAQTPSAEQPAEHAGPGPAQALVASAAYPGLGQLMNGAEPKAVLLGGAEAFLVARLVLEDRRTRHSLRLYNQTGRGTYFDDYSEHFDNRQTLLWWVVVAALLGIADAYVDAHLDNFDVAVPAALEAAEATVSEARSRDALTLGVAFRF